MTIEQRTFISPNDITAVEYGCAHCHAKYLTPLKDFSRVIQQCPNCQQMLVHTTHADSSHRSDERALHNFVEALKDVQQRIELRLRLEIAEPQSGESVLRAALGDE